MWERFIPPLYGDLGEWLNKYCFTHSKMLGCLTFLDFPDFVKFQNGVRLTENQYEDIQDIHQQ